MTTNAAPGQSGHPADTAREFLRAELRRTMLRRDLPAVHVMRSLIAAIDNAEAVPLEGRTGEGEPRAGAIETSALGVGAAETERRMLTVDEIDALLLADREERLAAASILTVTDPERAQRLRDDALLVEALRSRLRSP